MIGHYHINGISVELTRACLFKRKPLIHQRKTAGTTPAVATVVFQPVD